MKNIIAYVGLIATMGSLLALGSNFFVGLDGWRDVPTTRIPAQMYQKDRTPPPSTRKTVEDEASDLVVNVDDFSYTGVIRASAYNPFVPTPRRPPPPKKQSVVVPRK